MSKYLFIGAHVDDVQLSCGGTIHKLTKGSLRDNEVWVVTMSSWYDKGNLTQEFINSLAYLGVSNYQIYDFTVRHFANERQRILDLFITLKDLKFDYIFTHSTADFHQDHAIIGQESIRAFKNSNLYTYTAPWNQRTITKNHFFNLSTYDIEGKINSLKCFESQSHRQYMAPEYIMSDIKVNGLISGSEYSEGFEVINQVI